MSTWAVIGIIAIVLGVIVSNIMLLKYSAKFKMPKTYTPPEASHKNAAETPDDNTPPTTADQGGDDSKQSRR